MPDRICSKCSRNDRPSSAAAHFASQWKCKHCGTVNLIPRPKPYILEKKQKD